MWCSTVFLIEQVNSVANYNRSDIWCNCRVFYRVLNQETRLPRNCTTAADFPRHTRSTYVSPFGMVLFSSNRKVRKKGPLGFCGHVQCILSHHLTTAGFLPLIVSSRQRREAITSVDAPWRPARTTNKTSEAVIFAASASIL